MTAHQNSLVLMSALEAQMAVTEGMSDQGTVAVRVGLLRYVHAELQGYINAEENARYD